MPKDIGSMLYAVDDESLSEDPNLTFDLGSKISAELSRDLIAWSDLSSLSLSLYLSFLHLR